MDASGLEEGPICPVCTFSKLVGGECDDANGKHTR